MSSAAVVAPALISVDWGTTSLRCWLVAHDGTVLDGCKTQRGILRTDGKPFGEILHQQINPWLSRFPNDAGIPVMLSGMIGSRQGWCETPYVQANSAPGDLAANLQHVETCNEQLGRCDIRIVPGLAFQGEDSLAELPDVMRGEETQVLGTLLREGVNQGVAVLPGTHSKWVLVQDRRIVRFDTYMTGEVYAGLLDSTILGQFAEGDAIEPAAFELGVRSAEAAHNSGAAPGDFLRLVFSARTRVLMESLAPRAVKSYLSGLLIGAEITSASARYMQPVQSGSLGGAMHILADEPLRSRYVVAAELLGLVLSTSDVDPVPVLHLDIARRAGMITQREQ